MIFIHPSLLHSLVNSALRITTVPLRVGFIGGEEFREVLLTRNLRRRYSGLTRSESICLVRANWTLIEGLVPPHVFVGPVAYSHSRLAPLHFTTSNGAAASGTTKTRAYGVAVVVEVEVTVGAMYVQLVTVTVWA